MSQKLDESGRWIPASGGTEEPFTLCGTRYLYMYQPSSGLAAYINLDTDIFLSDAQADALFR